MRSYLINNISAGRTLGRYLEKILPCAPESYLYKALRNNKIKLNGKKPADLKVTLLEGDELKLFFTEEQFADFCPKTEQKEESIGKLDYGFLSVVYEDEHMVIFNKPAGLLSQKDESDAVSANEYGLAYLSSIGFKESPEFKPGVINRLDRNTSGLLLMAKDLQSAQVLSQIVSDKSLGKYYLAIVDGFVEWKDKTLEAYWKKDQKSNKVSLSPESDDGGKAVSLRAKCLHSSEKASVMEVRLLTGKSHQIRAQLASIGHPIVGDYKYGYRGSEKKLMLCAYKLVFPECPEPLAYMKGKTIQTDVPPYFNQYKRIVTL